jgi:hypothetical protein
MKATVGRIVHFMPDWANALDPDNPKPLAAIVIDALDGDRVRLGVFAGTYFTVTSIHQEPSDSKPAGPGTWHWPPR